MDSFDTPRRLLGFALAGLAGYVDAVGFLSADSYFVSFMSGNTTRLGVDLARDWRAALTPALLIAGFVTGSAIGCFVAIRAGRRRKAAVLGLVAMLLLAAASFGVEEFAPMALAALVLAMGAMNNTLERNEVSVGLTYMTGALVRLGQGIGSALAGKPRRGWSACGVLWSGLAAGSTAGATMYLKTGGLALWPAAAIALVLALAGAKLAAPPDTV
ncbi:DUF1275 family protein [Novosphingobium marinum]|uniref:Uncharacterized membrane protein YoaK (UPF0700 family) n=1 Tax=Novosphingobium marinum TaxID=1514948 RepID=A0A7Y9XZ93_9SPHN|nr:YoaK family protein [Novosphingobium marinum]NYH95671.1 uncharacterized membrane protein YoaK (UPF0700 family) [Novosphingobium marinum]GGC28916.1 DUF1275 family protein [Novosphingobium marinum]